MQEAFRENPNNDELPLMGARILQEDGDLAGTAEQALEALEVRPRNPVALNMLGVLCNEAGRPDLARDLFRRVAF